MDVSLKEHLESRIDALQREMDTRFDALQEAIALARKEMEWRLAELNQLRKDVVQDRDQLVRREVYEPAIKELNTQLYKLSSEFITMSGDVAANTGAMKGTKGTLTWLARLVVGALIVSLVGLIGLVFRVLVER